MVEVLSRSAEEDIENIFGAEDTIIINPFENDGTAEFINDVTDCNSGNFRNIYTSALLSNKANDSI